MNIALYAHGGSGNHGCEALVRSTIKVLGAEHHYKLLSEAPDEDKRYHLDEIAEIIPARDEMSGGLRYMWYLLRMKCTHDDRVYYREIYRSFIKRLGNCDLALAIGGDNYCYKGFLEQYSVLNDMLQLHGIPSALWGCSIDPERINETMLRDLRNYKLITARESLTYEALLSHGLQNVHLVPDTAFMLDKIDWKLSEGFQEGNTVGINVSPMIIGHEQNPGIVMKNYETLIQYILTKTDMSVALIPHVIWESNDDRKPLKQLYDMFSSSKRVVMIDDADCRVLKGYISRCRFMIAARTHASIAAYSTGVPALVIGYSVKAQGIAKDLFGDFCNMVLNVDKLRIKDELLNAFEILQSNEDNLKNNIISFNKRVSCRLYQQIGE
jgi:polysaccharide pyruvyl transferase WcaK-like protein